MAERDEGAAQPSKKQKVCVEEKTRSALDMEASTDPVGFLEREQPDLKFDPKMVEEDGKFLWKCTVKVGHKTYYKTSEKSKQEAKYLVAKHVIEVFGWEKLMQGASPDPGNTLCYVSCRNLL